LDGVQAWDSSSEENSDGTTPIKTANPIFPAHLLNSVYKTAHFSGWTNQNQGGARTWYSKVPFKIKQHLSPGGSKQKTGRRS
jgi:hypothetical protein